MKKKINAEDPTVLEWKNKLEIILKDPTIKGPWKRLYKLVCRSTRARNGVNLYKINKYTKENEYVIVPSKVLGVGVLDHKVNIAALGFSDSAKSAIQNNGSSILDIDKLLSEKRVKIIM
ncbi:MAG: 50S ribosomal protein L18e [Candidatus Micrarchaeia archaeon]